MKEYIRRYTRTLKPFSGIFRFLAVLLASHFLWKWAVDADLHGQEIAVFGKDCTQFFYRLSQWTAKVIYWFSGLWPGSEHLHINNTHFYFSERNIIINIIWGCTGVKQAFIFLVILALYPGPLKKKLWYIPLGIFILWAYNIFRITAIVFLTRYHPEWFDTLHEGILRYLYYGLIFFLWLYWEEKLRKPKIQT